MAAFAVLAERTLVLVLALVAIVTVLRDVLVGRGRVAFVARHTDNLEAADIYRRCRRELAGYKQPKEIYFVAAHELPRSASGKIQRHELEKRLTSTPASTPVDEGHSPT